MLEKCACVRECVCVYTQIFILPCLSALRLGEAGEELLSLLIKLIMLFFSVTIFFVSLMTSVI